MKESVYFLTIGLPLVTLVLIFGMKYYSAAVAARARFDNDAAYSALAEKAVAAQVESRTALAAIEADLARVNASLAAVEKILKQVE
jgi:hypothetical protein